MARIAGSIFEADGGGPISALPTPDHERSRFAAQGQAQKQGLSAVHLSGPTCCDRDRPRSGGRIETRPDGGGRANLTRRLRHETAICKIQTPGRKEKGFLNSL